WGSAMNENEILQWLRSHAAPSAHLHMDSRQVQPGDVFLACPGSTVDGRRYLTAAAQAGAAAIIYEADALPQDVANELGSLQVARLPVHALRARAGELASAWYDHPSHQLAV